MPSFRVGKPRAKIGLLVNTAMPVNGGPVPWTTAFFQEPVVWTVTAPTAYVIPLTGLWLIETTLWRASVNTASRFGCGITVNGTRRAADRDQGITTTASVASSCTLIDELVAGDTVEVTCLATGGIGAVETLSAVESHMSITRIGPDRWT